MTTLRIRKTLNSGCSKKIENVKKLLKKRGEIDYRSFSPKRKRYENPDVKCQKCGQIIGISEEEHLLRHCRAMCLGTPIPTRDYEYSASKFKRIRRLALYDYPP